MIIKKSTQKKGDRKLGGPYAMTMLYAARYLETVKVFNNKDRVVLLVRRRLLVINF